MRRVDVIPLHVFVVNTIVILIKMLVIIIYMTTIIIPMNTIMIIVNMTMITIMQVVAFAAVVWLVRRVDVHLLRWILLHGAPYERGELLLLLQSR